MYIYIYEKTVLLVYDFSSPLLQIVPSHYTLGMSLLMTIINRPPPPPPQPIKPPPPQLAILGWYSHQIEFGHQMLKNGPIRPISRGMQGRNEILGPEGRNLFVCGPFLGYCTFSVIFL